MKPQDFFIGLRDFFSVLVPGIVFLSLQPLDRAQLLPSQAIEAALALVIAAYILGSVAAALGACLDWAADPLIEHPLRKRLLGGRLEDRKAAAEDIRAELLKGCSSPLLAAAKIGETKGFWWDHLRLNSDVAIAELDRLEASQKLFRSLVATFLLLAVFHAIPSEMMQKIGPLVKMPSSHNLAARALLVAAIISALLYVGRRYLFLTTLYRLAGAYALKGCSSTKAPAVHPPTSAAPG